MEKSESNMLIAEILEIQVRTYEDGTISYRPDKSWESLIPAIDQIGCKIRDNMLDFTMFWEENEIYVQAIEDAVWTDDIDQAYEALMGLIEKYSPIIN